jgi:hypothetical protein
MRNYVMRQQRRSSAKSHWYGTIKNTGYGTWRRIEQLLGTTPHHYAGTRQRKEALKGRGIKRNTGHTIIRDPYFI